jgi:hypothetical protein
VPGLAELICLESQCRPARQLKSLQSLDFRESRPSEI